MDRLDRMLALAHDRVPGLRLVHKRDVPWMRALAVALRPINPTFATEYTTVIGRTIYLPDGAAPTPRDRLAITLAHELVHMLDMAEHGISFYATYLVAPAPFMRTKRAYWERRGYAVDLLIAREAGGPAAVRRTERWLAGIFSGPAYGWMWAGRGAAAEYLRPTVESVLDGSIDRTEPYRSILAAWRGSQPDTPEFA
ncbi:MAG: hypothetical protein ACI8PZ_000204 [Myxococcota bacterium]|jgi:hypothetical protein